MERDPARRALLIASVASAWLASGSPAAAARNDWREMTTGHFHLFSTLRDSGTRQVAQKLQAFEQTVGEILKSEERLPDIPTLIFILNRDDFRKYAADRPGLAGLFAQREFANYIVMDGDEQSDSTLQTVFHEYTHFIQHNTHTVQFPPWYSEGYAELFSAFRIRDNQIVLGEAPKGLRISLYKEDWMPVERLLAVTMNDKEYRAEALMPQFYGESWTLVHYLLFDDAKLALPTARYLSSLDLGAKEQVAFAHAFQFTKEELDKQIQQLLLHQIIVIKRWTVPSAPTIESAPITRITAARADLELARVALEIGRPKEVAQPLLDAALAENPDSIEMRALSAHAAAVFGAEVDIQELVGRLGAGSEEPRARMDLARAAFGRHPDVRGARTALGLLGDLAHAPEPPLEAAILWARAAVLANVAPAEIAAVLEPAQQRAPHHTEIVSLLANAAEQAGERAKARAYYERLILIAPTDEYRRWAVRQADSERLQDRPARR